jgi:hypothetical protein
MEFDSCTIQKALLHPTNDVGLPFILCMQYESFCSIHTIIRTSSIQHPYTWSTIQHQLLIVQKD